MNVIMRLPIFKENVCRLCAIGIEDSKLFPIFDSGFNEIGIRIKEILPALDIKLDDLKPQQICKGCLDKLNICRKFLYCCIESDFKFDSYIQQCQDQEEDILKTSQTSELGKMETILVETNGCRASEKATGDDSDGCGQDYVLMVEVKYKNGIADGGGSEEDTILEGFEDSTEGTTSVMDGEPVLTINEGEEDDRTVLLLEESGKGVNTKQQSLSQVLVSATAQSKISIQATGRKVFECPICQRQFGRRSRLTAHVVCVHSVERPHECSECHVKLATRAALRSHTRTEHTREFECSPCRRAFPSADKLARHLRTHTGERPFACHHCSKAFADKRNLENHIRTHTGERPYACTQCMKVFTVRSHATDHAKRVHHRSPEYFQCQYCTKRYRWKNKYRWHLKIKHPDKVGIVK